MLLMSKPTAFATDLRSTVTLLSVTPYEEDQLGLQSIISHSKWRLYGADRLESALAVLHEHAVGVVLSEKDLPPHSWTDMLYAIHHLQDAPAVIVASRLADERLWAEALNLGAYDVLAKPFDRDEVLRSVSLAWLNWHHKHEIATGSATTLR
jgi:DNA-binding NtrC family response regulator